MHPDSNSGGFQSKEQKCKTGFASKWMRIANEQDMKTQKAEKIDDQPHIPMGSRRNESKPLYEEHKPWSSIPCSLEPATRHLQNQNVRSQQPLCAGRPAINLLSVELYFVGWKNGSLQLSTRQPVTSLIPLPRSKKSPGLPLGISVIKNF